ncbi:MULTISPECIES: hypothetical protein [unclassified Mycobacterium]|uniref:hypothetical protein n=1 Tax=unclassified Mycobacterium TaxID=2642494 RepID=UPI0029C8ABD8|nr:MULTISPECIES: hypothetical protein [unclassified Mycobacterium]
MRTFFAVALFAGIAIGTAPPSSADEHEYLHEIQPELAYLSSNQLLTEGYKVCRFLSPGRESSDAVPMVIKDLGVSVAAAMYIVPTAIEQLDC